MRRRSPGICPQQERLAATARHTVSVTIESIAVTGWELTSGALRRYGCADGSDEHGVEHGDGKVAATVAHGVEQSARSVVPAVWCQFIQERRDFLVALRQTVSKRSTASWPRCSSCACRRP
jgi:hypothetical protein